MNFIDKLVFEGLDGKDIVADLRCENSDDPRGLILFCHGFKGFKDWGHFNLIADAFASEGFIVLKFNFSHNGGTVEEPIDFPDLEAFAENNYIKELNDISVILDNLDSIGLEEANWNGEVYLMGHSRGGGVVLVKAAEDHRVSRVVTWASISSFQNRMPGEAEMQKWKDEGVAFIMNARSNQNMPMNYQFVNVLEKHSELLNIEDACKKIMVPHLIIHGDRDETVLFSEAENLKNWNEEAELVKVEGANHTFNGSHPWLENELPEASIKLVEITSTFLKTNNNSI